jgi:hypothetical protein
MKIRVLHSERALAKMLEVEKDSKTMIVPNPDYAMWCVRDQPVLMYLVMSVSREVLVGVASNTMVVDMWAVISKTFASQLRSYVLHLHNQLVATKKKEMSVTMYVSTRHGYADEMATAGKLLDDDDIVSYIVNGLDEDYNSLIEHINGMIDSISQETMYSWLLDIEARLASQRAQQLEQKDQFHMMANASAHGHSGTTGPRQQQHGGFQGSRGGGRTSGSGGRLGNPNNP